MLGEPRGAHTQAAQSRQHLPVYIPLVLAPGKLSNKVHCSKPNIRNAGGGFTTLDTRRHAQLSTAAQDSPWQEHLIMSLPNHLTCD